MKLKTIILSVVFGLILSLGVSPCSAAEQVYLPKTEDTKWQQLSVAASMTVEEVKQEVPLYNQLDYPDVPYGDYGTVASHGCGITCLAMVVTYLTDTEYLPDELAQQFGKYNSESGSYWILFEDSAKFFKLEKPKRTFDTNQVMDALRNGQVVIALQSPGMFTNGGHYIVLTGLNERGRIVVNDPYGPNYYKNLIIKAGFEKGFTTYQIFENGGPYWIYDKKVLPIQAALSDLQKDMKCFN